VAVKYTNNAKSTLASGINSSVTSATVADGSIFPALGAGEYFYITFDDGSNNEIAKVTARSGNTLTIVRAQDNTTARAFSTGDSAELRVIAAVLTEIQENIAAKSANQTVYSATAASNATDYNIGVDPGVEANASVFLDGVYQHHDTFSFSGSTLSFDAAPTNGTKIEVVVDNLINLQSSNLTVDTFTATSGQTAFTLSDAPGGESNVLAFIDGVFQNQASFSLSSNTLTFDTGVVVGRSVTVYIINPVNIGTPSDGTVTSAKLSGNITTPGTLTVGSHDVAFDSPTFVVDNSNSRVGLGTASPSVPVDIVGEGKISSHFTILDAGSLKVGTGADMVLSSDGTHGTIAAANGNLTLDVAGDIKLDSDSGSWRFQDNGGSIIELSVGSGSSPTFYSATSDADIVFRGNDGGSAITALTLDMSDAGSAFFNSDVYIDKYFRLRTTDDQANQWLLYTHTNDSLEFNYNGSGNAEVVIDTSGNVGIGTTSPAAALHVEDSGSIASIITRSGSGTNSFENTAIIDCKTGNDAADGFGPALYFTFTDSGVTRSEIANISVIRDGADNSGQMQFGVRNAGTWDYDALVIDSTSKVGIGTASPDDYTYGDLVIDGAGASAGISLVSTTSSYGGIFFADGTSGSEKYRGFLQYNHNYSGLTDMLLFGSGGATNMVLDGSGNLGIGTDSPDRPLHICGPDGTTGLVEGNSRTALFLDNAGATYINLASANNANAGLFFSDPQANNRGAILYEHANDALTFDTQALERLRIHSDGTAILGQSTTSLGNYGSNNSGHTQLNHGKIGHQYNATGTVHTFGTYTHPSAMYGTKTDGSTHSWNRLLWIDHRSSYLITIWTAGGWYGPTAHVVKVDTNYSNTISTKSVTEGTAGSYSVAIRFTAPNAGTGGGWLDFQNSGGSSGGTAYSGIYVSVTPLMGANFIFASLKSEAAGDTVSTLTHTVTKTNASDY